MRRSRWVQAATAALLASVASTCEQGTQPPCLAAFVVEDGQCLPPCPEDEEYYDHACVRRCAADEMRIDGVCTAPPKVRVNSIGYLPGAEKWAIVVGVPLDGRFDVVDQATGDVAFEGPLTGPIDDADTQQPVWRGDFSALVEPGTYQVRVAAVGESAPFAIAANVYKAPLHAAMLGFYGLRCGEAVAFDYHGQRFGHDRCHAQDAFSALSSPQHVSATGGWHDAGDYGKYIVNSSFTVGMLLQAWEHFSATLTELSVPELPEHDTGALPDILAETKYNLDWMLLMQQPDGSVHHKLTAANFEAFIMPENDRADRALAPVSAEAAAGFAASMALASRVYAPFDAEFGQRCLLAAEQAQAWLDANPDYPPVDLTGFSTGQYKTTSDDDRFWALVELWATTGDADYLQRAEGRLVQYVNAETKVRSAWDWSDVENLGLFTYALHAGESNEAQPAFRDEVEAAIIESADSLVAHSDASDNGYGRALTAYYWGSNGIVARTAINLFAAYALTQNAAYPRVAQRQLSHLLGVNGLGRSLVTGVGYLPPLHPHHRPSGADGVVQPWPGLLVGGPNGESLDANQGYDLSIPALAWQDVQASYWSNEVAINWNGAWVYALSWANSMATE